MEKSASASLTEDQRKDQKEGWKSKTKKAGKERPKRRLEEKDQKEGCKRKTKKKAGRERPKRRLEEQDQKERSKSKTKSKTQSMAKQKAKTERASNQAKSLRGVNYEKGNSNTGSAAYGGKSCKLRQHAC